MFLSIHKCNLIYYNVSFLNLFSGIYEEAATKSRQALLRYKANQIADYEALHHIHFWPQEPIPKYIYYIGQAKNFEEWYKSGEGDRGPIYKEFEEKSTFKIHNFKESTFDKYSIWKFDKKDSNKDDETEMSTDLKDKGNSIELHSEDKNEIQEIKKLVDIILHKLNN